MYLASFLVVFRNLLRCDDSASRTYGGRLCNRKQGVIASGGRCWWITPECFLWTFSNSSTFHLD